MLNKLLIILKKINELTYSKHSLSNYYCTINKQEIKNMIDTELIEPLECDAKLRKECNRNLVKVTTHGGSCELCKKWEGKILCDDVFINVAPNYNYPMLSKAIKQGLFHEGCRHGLSTYYPELKGISYNTKEK